MTENTPGAAGNVPEHQQPAEGAATPVDSSPPQSIPGQLTPDRSTSDQLTPGQPTADQSAQAGAAPIGQPSPWSAAGYQTYRPAEQSTTQLPGEAPGPYPTIQAAQLPGAAPIDQPTSGYQNSEAHSYSDNPNYPPMPASENTGGYPSLGSSETSANYPNTGSSETPGGYPGAGVNFGSYPPLSGQPIATMPVNGSPRRRRGALVAGVAVLALVVGGAAGSLGGYLFSGSNSDGTVQSALNEPVPTATQASAPAGSVQAVANKVLPTVVEISVQVQSAQGMSGDTGSGIILSSDGEILTNNHVVADAANGAGQIQVIFSTGKSVNATIIGRDPTSDVAVIKAQGVSGLPIASLGTASSLQVGQEVVAIGAPYGLSGTVTSGIVSSLHRPTVASDGGQNSQETVMDAIQTDAPINPGNSGGALVNMQGQVIGINSAIYSSPSTDGSQGGNVGIGFAIPIDQARRLANDIITTGHSTQTVLGVQVADNVEGVPAAQQGQISQDQQSEEEQAGLTNGAYIVAVTSGGPAAKANLQQGAVVTKANGRLITSANGLVAAVHAAAPQDQMVLTLSNNSTVTVTLSGETVPTN